MLCYVNIKLGKVLGFWLTGMESPPPFSNVARNRKIHLLFFEEDAKF